MNPLDTLAAWLVTYALHSTLMLGLAWVVGATGRRGDGATRHPATTNLLWKVALVGGIVTATAQTSLGVRPAGSLALGSPLPAAGAPTPAPAYAGEATVERAVEEVGKTEGREDGRSNSATVDATRPPISATNLLVIGWGALSLLLVTWYAGRRLILVGRLGDRRVVSEGPLPGVLAELRRQAGVRRPVQLTSSATISSPVALGTGEICLPAAALVELEPTQQRAMLAHELAHLVRRDPQWLGLACLVERAFFFQPLNRLARSRMQQSAEYLADEWAAGRTGHVPLARCLVKVAEWIQASPLGVPVAGMAEERSELSARVSRLLEGGTSGAGLPRWAGGLTAAGSLALVVAFAPGAGRIPLAEDVAGLLGSSPEAMPTASPEPTENPIRLPEFTSGVKAAVGAALHDIDGPPATRAEGDTTVVRALIARLRDDDAGVRQAAADALGRIGDPLAIPDLVRALEDAEPEVRHSALNALSQFERGVPAAPIRKLLGSEEPELRATAAEMLGEMKSRESVPAISALLRDPSAEVRQHAVQALAEIGDPSAGPAMAAALADADADVRHSAFHAMEHLNAPVAPAAVSRGLGDQDADVRVAAIELASERRMVEVVPDLVRLLEDPKAEVRESAASALTEMPSDGARTALRGALTHKDPKVRRVAVEYFGEEEDQ